MIVIYRIYQILITVPILIVATIITASTTAVMCLFGGQRFWGYHLPRIWARLFCAMTLVKVEVRGCQHISDNKSYVFVANHQGSYDIFAIYGYLGHNFRWMMKKSLEKLPFVGQCCKVSGHIFVDNSTPKAIKETMTAAKKQLAGGMSVVVFPEGSRTPDGKLKRFKRGAYILATEYNLPVVPITIDGAYDVMPRHALLPHWGKITLTIHPALEASTDGYDLADLMDKSRAAIASALPEFTK